MATVRMTLDETIGMGSVDRAKLDATTEADIRRHLAEDGFAPDDPMAGLRRVYSPAEIRERTGLTQPEIAARLRVPVKTWRNWEQGRTSLDPAVRSLLDIVAEDPARAFVALGTVPRPTVAADARELFDLVTGMAKTVENLRQEMGRQVHLKQKPTRTTRHVCRVHPAKAEHHLLPRTMVVAVSPRPADIGDGERTGDGGR